MRREAIAPLWAIWQERGRLQEAQVHLYVDDIGAQFVVAKGLSSVGDTSAFAAALWMMISKLGIELEGFRVTTKESPADTPPETAAQLGQRISLQYLCRPGSACSPLGLVTSHPNVVLQRRGM